MDDKLHTLEQLHLTEYQSRVYLAVLELGQGSIQDIAKKSGVVRSSVYNQLADLKARSVVQEVRKGKRTVYSAASPDQLVEQEKKRIAAFERVLPQFLAVFNASPRQPRVMFYEGVEGIKTIYRDVIKMKQPLIGISDFENSIRVLRPFYETFYIPQRVRRNILARYIVRDSPAAREWGTHDNRDLRETKYLSYAEFSVEVSVYGDTVALMNFRGTPPLAVKIVDAAIAGTIRVAWEQLWQRLGENNTQHP